MTELQPELFNELRELDLWKQVFAVGIEGLEEVSEYEWNFSNLDDAFEEGGVLHGNRVYLFSFSEPQLLFFHGQSKVTLIPTVVAVVSPSPPSDKIAVFSGYFGIQLMNLDWVPYTPQGQRGPSFERLEPEIFMLNGVPRRADFRGGGGYCLPYLYNPLEEDEEDQVFNVIYPLQPEPIVCSFDAELDDDDGAEDIMNAIIVERRLSEDQKDDFKEFVMTKFQEGKRAYHEARKNRLRAPQPELAVNETMRFYKFYPVPTADTPDISQTKSQFINKYYGKAHQVY